MIEYILGFITPFIIYAAYALYVNDWFTPNEDMDDSDWWHDNR